MRWLFSLLAWLVVLAPATAEPPRRVALLIGNSSYDAATKLLNPSNDVKLVAEAAKRAGFQTITQDSNLGRLAFENALRKFRNEADGAEVAMVYFAGHGIEGDDQNWLIPTDAKLESSRDLAYEAIALERVLEALDGAAMRLVVLDACRNNPFGRNWTTGKRAVTRGLVAVSAADILVMYAAAPGATASDGSGANSPFAVSFAKRLPEPNVPIQLLAGLVRDDVLAATDGGQRPFIGGSVTGTPFYLVGSGAPARQLSPIEAEAVAWSEAHRAATREALQKFVASFPASQFVGDARAAIQRINETEFPEAPALVTPGAVWARPKGVSAGFTPPDEAIVAGRDAALNVAERLGLSGMVSWDHDRNALLLRVGDSSGRPDEPQPRATCPRAVTSAALSADLMLATACLVDHLKASGLFDYAIPARLENGADRGGGSPT